MRKIFLLFFVLRGITTAYGQQKTDTIVNTSLTAEDLIRNIEKEKAYLIDVRTPAEYEQGHLKHSKNIDFQSEDFTKLLSKLDKNTPVYLYCRSGNRSSKAAEVLKELGFKEYYNIGGFENLKTAGLPAE